MISLKLDINKFTKLCERVRSLNEFRDDDLTRPCSRNYTNVTISRCMDNILDLLEESNIINKHTPLN